LARKILLADDSVTAQNMGRKILADAGYEVITVNNGSAALKKIGEIKPDLIVLDVYMPGYSGLEVCQRLKETGDTSRIPILLTVGKLEPFKPEEAKRVRADGYIVKPFEASELLSALSKLEDKVVPRPEASKPGRFARATAAIEEARYDKSMAVEEDSGWKNRISFPSKKKEKPKAEEIDTGEIYNPVNKDLRTVVEHTAAESTPAAPTAAASEARVNLGSLAPEGLPKDVTPEEIAALAAAAAQIKGTAADGKPAKPAAEPVQEVPKTQGTEAKAESKEDARPPVPEVAPTTPAATFAEQDTKEKTEEKKAGPAIVSTHADAMNAIMGLETQVMAVFDPPGNGSWGHGKSERLEEPMTMAAAAVAAEAAAATASRWTAVAVALAPDEASLSLEQEMRKAYADFAAAESGHAAAVASASEAKRVDAETAAPVAAISEPPVAETAASQPESQIPATPAPEEAQPLAAVSEAATEAISAAVKELEAVAAKYEANQSVAPSEPASDKSLKAAALESPMPAVREEPAKIEDRVEEKTEVKAEEPIEAKAEEKIELPAEGKIEAKVEPNAEERGPEPPPQDLSLTVMFAVPSAHTAPQVEESPVEDKPAPVIETSAVESKTEVAEQQPGTEKVSTEPEPVAIASTVRGSDDMAKRESETAAAWATWRKIRETGAKPVGEECAKESDEAPRDTAAMAVAAGAESKPEEVASLDSDPEIASLVDSVMADMRPRIVEEIARKLGKKK